MGGRCCADFTSLVPKGDYVCMITHFETPDPGATYLSTLTQAANGTLTMMKTEPMDWSAYDGIWVSTALPALLCLHKCLRLNAVQHLSFGNSDPADCTNRHVLASEIVRLCA
jgi:hypothetical protein